MFHRKFSFSTLVASGALTLLFAPTPVSAASLQTNVSYGSNGAVMNLYVPDAVDEFPAIVVSLHYCGGSASNAASWFTGLADRHGFILIAPGLPSSDGDGCWDVGSSQSLSHDGGSHSKAIVQMVQHVITEHGADPDRVYAAGASSGAMMTNVLLGAYPDVFAAGSALAGVPFGCWTAGDGWTSECANGQTKRSASEWGDRVRNAYPGYDGPRPRVQLFHGTSDTTLNHANLAELVKQWTNVLGLSEQPTTTEPNAPKSGWTRTSYEDAAGVVALEVAEGQGVGHDLTGQSLWGEVVRFFALDVDVAPGVGEPDPGGAGGSPSEPVGNGGAGGEASPNPIVPALPAPTAPAPTAPSTGTAPVPPAPVGAGGTSGNVEPGGVPVVSPPAPTPSNPAPPAPSSGVPAPAPTTPAPSTPSPTGPAPGTSSPETSPTVVTNPVEEGSGGGSDDGGCRFDGRHPQSQTGSHGLWLAALALVLGARRRRR